jgi:uncharacterized protein (TIGR03083 family)
VEVDEARAALAEATARFTDLIRSAPDPTARVHDSEWSIADVAAHVTVAECYAGYLRDDLPAVLHVGSINRDNAANLASLQERSIDKLVARIRSGSEAFLDATSSLGLDHPMRWHDVPATVGAVYGIYLGELLVHGRDVARTIGRPWPISRAEAMIVFEGMTDIARWFVDPPRAADGVLEVNVRGGPSYTFAFVERTLEVERGRADRADCRIWGEAEALVLVLYKRTNQWLRIARGQLIAGGRRPWLALTFAARFSGY